MNSIFCINKIILQSVIILSLQISAAFGQSDFDTLLLVQEGKFWGYINTNGEWAIKPTFWAAQNFSEGLAAVRPNGLYGYISTTGKLIIPDKYDRAEPFTDGYAKVYIGRKPFYINKSNKILFDHNYAGIEYIPNTQLFKVLTKKSKKGIIDKNNKIIIDTIYSSITTIEDYAFLVEGYDQKGVIDKTGKVIIPVGKYSIGITQGDWVYARQYKNDSLIENLLINLRDQSKSLKIPLNRRVQSINGKIIYLNSTEHGINNSTEIMSLKGKIIYKDNGFDISEFNNGRAFLYKFCEYGPNEIYLIDENINYLAGPFSTYANSPFIDGYNLVELGNNWNLIDTNGRLTSLNISGNLSKIDNKGNFVISYDFYYNLRTRSISKAQYSRDRFHSEFKGFLFFKEGQDVSVVNPLGELIWKSTSTQKLNIDYRAYSFLEQHSNFHHGNKYIDTCTRNDIHLRFIEKNNTHYLILANKSNESIQWNGDIILSVQVLDTDKKWKGITGGYDGCGYGMDKQTFLKKDECMTYSLEKFEGSVKSLLRVKFVYQDAYGFQHSIYSNSIPCSYNPGQITINYNKYSF